MVKQRSDLILIASADRNWGIGCNNQLLKRISEDMKRFSSKTKNNMIIVGRKTLESFKDKKPLKERINVVLTKTHGYECEDAVIVHSIDELMAAVSGFSGLVYVCGGETVYRQLLPFCSIAEITRIDESFYADSYLPNLDADENWYIAEEDGWQESVSGVRFKYVQYKRKT